MKTRAEIDAEIAQKEAEIEELEAQLNTPKFSEFPVKIKMTKEVRDSLFNSGLKLPQSIDYITLLGSTSTGVYRLQIPGACTSHYICISHDDYFEEYKKSAIEDVVVGEWFTLINGGLPVMKTTTGFVNTEGYAFVSLPIFDITSFELLGKITPDRFIEYMR